MNAQTHDPRVFAVCKPYAPDFFSDPYVVFQAGLLFLFLMGIFSLVALSVYKWYFKKPATLWDRALKELDKIAQKEVKSKDDIKLSYYDLTRLVKWYVEERFLIPVMPLTDDEAVSYMQRHIQDSFVVEHVASLFHAALGVKYARYETVYESLQRDIKAMQDVIRHTIPQTTR